MRGLSKPATMLTCAIVCIVGVLAISIVPGSFGSGPYTTVHGPIRHVGSLSDWRVVVARWTNPELCYLLVAVSFESLPSADPRTLTCKMTC